jgi:hypothetical protein
VRVSRAAAADPVAPALDDVFAAPDAAPAAPDDVVPDDVVPDDVMPDDMVPDDVVPDDVVPDDVVPDAAPAAPDGAAVLRSVFFSVFSPDLSDFASDLLRPFARSTAPAAASPRSTTSTSAMSPTGRRGGTANDSDAPAIGARACVLLCCEAGRTSEPGGGVEIGAAVGGGSEGGAYDTGPGGIDDGARDATFPCGYGASSGILAVGARRGAAETWLA